MNPNAFEILTRFNLPQPRVYDEADLSAMPSNDTLFVRSTNQTDMRSRVMPVEAIRDYLNSYYKKSIGQPPVIFESTYEAICGGITLVKSDFSYTELVAGHSIALLRRGLCGARALISNNGIIGCAPVFQGWRAKQNGIHGYLWEPEAGPDNNFITDVMKELLPYLQISHSGLLLEWFKCPEGIIFCDAWNTGFEDFGNDLCNMMSYRYELPVYLSRPGKVKKHIVCDGFDVDYRPQPEQSTMLIACNSSLLCHYVKRNLDKRISVYLRNTHV